MRTSALALLTLLTAGCGAPSVRPPSAPAATPSACDADAAAEIEAIRELRSATEPVTALRARRAILARRRGGAFAEVEAEAERRVAAAERLASTVEPAMLAAQQRVASLRTTCSVVQVAAASKAKPAWAQKAQRSCERLAQANVVWSDPRAVARFADELESLRGLPDATPQREVVADVRKLAAALRGAAADRATLDAPDEAAERFASEVPACEPAARAPSLVVAKDPAPRSLTVVVVAKPPRELARQLEVAAREAEDESFAALLRGVATGRLGSGFVVTTRTNKWVVTNRHVVDLAESVSVVLDDGSTLDATTVYIDAAYDLAVLAPRDAKNRLAPRGGFPVAVRSATDGEAVTAMGYPAMLGSPSFQLTKGHVSNEHLVFPDGQNLVHVQHTAAIDPGSSGGPLLGPAREVLGVNTFKLVGRENVNFAVPGAEVVRALDAAEKASHCDGACQARAAKDGCLALVTELGRAQPKLAAVERLLGRDLVARDGIASHDFVLRGDRSIGERFVSSPVATLSEAVARSLLAAVGSAGGVHELETCGDLAPDGDGVKGSIALADGRKQPIAMRWESGRWVLSDWVTLVSVTETKPKNESKNERKAK